MRKQRQGSFGWNHYVKKDERVRVHLGEALPKRKPLPPVTNEEKERYSRNLRKEIDEDIQNENILNYNEYCGNLFTDTKYYSIYKNNGDYNYKCLHRFYCFNHTQIIRSITIRNFGDKKNLKEAFLIEFRILPNLEFLIRNAIIRLPNWNHTVVCGNNNYDFLKNICDLICKDSEKKINLIKLDIDNLTPSEYSRLLTTIEFWNNFKGEKLLLYQEDTMIFHSEIEQFLKYDWVGAPWPENQDDNSLGVGNGGLSLRSKSKMIECINIIKPENLKISDSTKSYMENTNSNFIPEDVYFTKAMIDYNIGIVAERNVAMKFSQETQKSENPFGGHNFWLAENKIDYDYLSGLNIIKCQLVGIYSPYKYSIGGGEYYISMLMKFFIKCGAKRIDFYNGSSKKMIKETMSHFFTMDEASVINHIHSSVIEKKSIADNTYDYFVEMGNVQAPTIKSKISKNLYIIVSFHLIIIILM